MLDENRIVLAEGGHLDVTVVEGSVDTEARTLSNQPSLVGEGIAARARTIVLKFEREEGAGDTVNAIIVSDAVMDMCISESGAQKRRTRCYRSIASHSMGIFNPRVGDRPPQSQ